MANKVIVGFYDSQTGLPTNTKALVFPAGSLVPINTADDVTSGNYNSFSFTLTESLTSGVRHYRVLLIDADDANAPISSYGWVVLSESAGTYYIDNLPVLDAIAFEINSKNLESPERDTADTRAIEFDWPISGATFANSASTCTRRFSGETGAQAEALSGTITAVSGVTGRYKLAYALADRAADAATVIPTEVTYTLVDDAGNSGTLTLRIVDSSGSVTILPLSGQLARRVSGTNISAFVNEKTPVAISVTDANDNEVDLESLTLEIVFENKAGTDITVLNDGDITKASNVATFTLPLTVTSDLSDKAWSMRNTANGVVLVRGVVGVTYAASGD